MHIVALSEFRANASAMLDLVVQGNTVRILRHGKPVADLMPVMDRADASIPHWKRAFAPVALRPGTSLSTAVLDERSEAV
ncbi:MAG: type II toxin-antitoxin system Phd/YefM family antitoxin [Burkholderiaceae bacterium]